VRDAFGYVLLVVVIAGAIAGVAMFALSGRAYREIGRGGLFEDTGGDLPGAGSDAERDEEIRQMLAARNARRAARGAAPVDVEAELARLVSRAHVDAGLEEEIRSLVIARNARRQRRGEEPLDVEAEVRRRLEELDG
jgi:hypothetical protein